MARPLLRALMRPAIPLAFSTSSTRPTPAAASTWPRGRSAGERGPSPARSMFAPFYLSRLLEETHVHSNEVA
jgi:hypothetical protein